MYKHELTAPELEHRSRFSGLLAAAGWNVAEWDAMFDSDSVALEPEGRAESHLNGRRITLEFVVPEKCLYLTFTSKDAEAVRFGFKYGERFDVVLSELAQSSQLESIDGCIALAKVLIPECDRVFYQIDEATVVVMSLETHDL